MTSFSEFPPEADKSAREQTAEDATSYFRRRILSNRRWLWPRRYVMALMLLVLLTIEGSREWNMARMFIYVMMEKESKIDYPSIGNWTVVELEHIGYFMRGGDIFFNILGALLIYQYSSYKFLLVSVTASSILHMLMPAALNHHSVTFLTTVMLGQEILSVPLYTAILSIWKDWAPPAERTRLVTISLCGMLLAVIGGIFFISVYPYIFQSMSYYVGIAGMVWVLFWYNTMSDIPQNDPLISEKEFHFLESSIPSNYQEKTKLKDVPWKSIAKSKQVIILCLIFFKIACSMQTIQLTGTLFLFQLSDSLIILIPFMVIFMLILFGTPFLMDYLLKKYRYKTLAIRRTFLCTGFGLQGVFLLGTIISPLLLVKACFYALAYSFMALSVPGALTLPLDLSPRYVSILAGIGFSFLNLGLLSFRLFCDHLFDSTMHVESWLFICDGIISLFIALIFGIWGDADEQPWSLLTSSHRRSHDYRSYPQPDDEDELNLVPEND